MRGRNVWVSWRGGQGMVVVGCGEDDGAEGYNRPI